MPDIKPLFGKDLLYGQAFDLPAKEFLCQLCIVSNKLYTFSPIT